MLALAEAFGFTLRRVDTEAVRYVSRSCLLRTHPPTFPPT
jgi:hypothetical protein